MAGAAENARRGFLTGGTWCLDRNRIISHWPEEDTLAEAWGLEERGGGSACNLGTGIRLLDASMPVKTIVLIGDDDAGRKLMEMADEVGISPTGFQITKEASTHVTDCFVSQATGRRTHITDTGSGALLCPDHFTFAHCNSRIFHFGLPGVHKIMDAPWEGDTNGWVAVLKSARGAKLKTSLEMVTYPPERLRQLVGPCLQHLDYLVVNDSEIAALAGFDDHDNTKPDPDMCLAAVRTVIDKGAMEIVALHSPEGAIAVHRDGTAAKMPAVAIPGEEIAGPNGAGDAFASGFLYGVHEGWSLEQCLELGHAAAACSLQSAGTTDGIRPWRVCLDAARSWGYRDNGW
jgi:sugar/nucleoside kinase (ribokinase family)